MNRSIRKAENRQYSISSPLLLLFSAPFIVWQMGVLYFSGTTMSLFGRTPVPLTSSVTLPVIAFGYIASIILICLFPRKTVLMERVALLTALAATVLMLFPFQPDTFTVLFYVSVFCCVFSIGAMMSVAVHHFTVETTWRDGIISMAIGGVLIAILQNEVFPVSFTVFTVFSVLLIAAQAVFFCIIPAKIEVRYAVKETKAKLPVISFAGIWLISGFATLLICFASTYAESVPDGVSVMYLFASILAVVLLLIKKKRTVSTVRVFGGFFALAVFGFVLAFLSLHIPELRLIACCLLGFIVVLANLWIFFAAVSFRMYPTRFVGAIGAAMGLVLACVHSGLQDALRGNLPLLYGIYAALSAALLLVYIFMEPYLIRVWQKAEVPFASNKVQTGGGKATVLEAPMPGVDPLSILSEQERILAGLILDGHTETSCARAMNITLNTEKSYRKNLYLKLDIHSKRELFELARGKADHA